MTDYISVAATAQRHGLSVAWVRRLAQRGDIPGAFLVGKSWAIPKEWTPPTVPRGRRATPAPN